MNYRFNNPKPERYGRRKFFKRTFTVGSATLLFGLGLKSLFADDLVKDPEILNKLSKIYEKIKERGNEFQYEERIDVNGDGKPDKVKFMVGEGSVTMGTNVTSGKRFELGFETGDGWQRKIYGIVDSKGEISLSKSRYLKSEIVKEYLDVVLEYYKK